MFRADRPWRRREFTRIWPRSRRRRLRPCAAQLPAGDQQLAQREHRGVCGQCIQRRLRLGLVCSCCVQRATQVGLDDYALDVERRELRCGQTLVGVEPQVFDLLVYLLQNRDRVVGKDDLIATVWGGRIVSASTLTSRINAARRALGDSGDQQRFIRTIARKGIRFVGDVREAHMPSELPAPVSAPVRNQEVTFCRTAEGVNLALATVGAGIFKPMRNGSPPRR